MFSFFRNKSLLRKTALLAFALVFSAGFLCVSCSESPDEDNVNAGTVPEGDWTDDFGSGYRLTSSSFEYYTAGFEWEGEVYPGSIVKGNITPQNFTSNSGVLIVYITSSDSPGLDAGKYMGTYYLNATDSSIQLANAYTETSSGWAPVLMNTLGEAKNTFTVDNVGTHVSVWGSYTK